MSLVDRHRRKGRGDRAISVMALTAAVVCALTAGRAWAADPSPLPEHQIKALYLFNFTKYVEWPTNALPGTNGSYTIGIAGTDEVYDDLQGIVNGRTVNGRKLVVQHIERAEDAKVCQIVFLGRGSDKLSAGVLDAVKRTPVLTVGEQEDFLSRGGMVRFAREDNKLRVEINLDGIQEDHMTVSARLLPVAKVIRKPRASARN